MDDPIQYFNCGNYLIFLGLIIIFDIDYHSLIHFDVESLIHIFFCCTKNIFLQSRSILSPVFVIGTISTMAFRHKTAEMQRRTAAIRDQHAAQAAASLERREKHAVQAAAALRLRTCTKLYNNAARRAAATLRQHQIAPNNPHSIDNARRIAHTARTHSRLVNPGPFLIEGPAPYPYYINAEVTNVENGDRQEFHFDHRHRSAAWIWDNATRTDIPRHFEPINLTE